MPQVNAIGTLAEPADRAKAQHLAPQALRVQNGEDRQHGSDGKQDQPAVVQEHRFLLHQHNKRHDARQADKAKQVRGAFRRFDGLTRLAAGG